jgi:hypothetical protein
VKKNESVVVGIYHPLTDALYLVGEYTQTQATAHSGNQAQEDSFAFGRDPVLLILTRVS